LFIVNGWRAKSNNRHLALSIGPAVSPNPSRYASVAFRALPQVQ
jgi:hypothetical protein